MPVSVIDPTDLGAHSPQIHRLGHRGGRIVYRADCTTVHDDASGLDLFAIDEVFNARDSVLLGFGFPNVYTAMRRANDDMRGPGWDKYAAFMFWRQKSFVANTKGRVQAGLIVEIRNLPDEALARLRSNMRDLSGKRGPSCAWLNAHLLVQSGFTLGNGRSLTGIMQPSKLFSRIWRFGLSYDSQEVDLRIVLTGNKGVGEHLEGMSGVWGREVTSPQRFAGKLYTKETRGKAPLVESRAFSAVDPARWQSRPTTIGINRPSWLGVKMAFVYGQQPVYDVNLGKLSHDALVEPLTPYPGKLDRITRLKKHMLFSRPVIRGIRHYRHHSTDVFEGVPARAAVEMLTPSQSPDYDHAVLYNCVVVQREDGHCEARITTLRNHDERTRESRSVRTFSWILAKHVLLAGYDPNTIYACEIWTCREGDTTTLYVNRNSGTYKPSLERLVTIAGAMQRTFNIRVVAVA